jgi:hypothetical protein
MATGLLDVCLLGSMDGHRQPAGWISPASVRFAISRLRQNNPTGRFQLFLSGKSSLQARPIPPHLEGRFANVTDVGAGCGGRGSAQGIAGRILSVSDRPALRRTALFAYGKTVVVPTPVAGAKLSVAKSIQPGSTSRQAGSDGDKTNSLAGEQAVKPLRRESTGLKSPDESTECG